MGSEIGGYLGLLDVYVPAMKAAERARARARREGSAEKPWMEMGHVQFRKGILCRGVYFIAGWLAVMAGSPRIDFVDRCC